MQLATNISSQENNIPFLSSQADVSTELPNDFGSSVKSEKTDSSFLEMVKSYEPSSESEKVNSSPSESEPQKVESEKTEVADSKEKKVSKEESLIKTEKSKSTDEEKKSKVKVRKDEEKKESSSEENSVEVKIKNISPQTVLKEANKKELNVEPKIVTEKDSNVEEIQSEQLTYLKTRAETEDPESILANVQEYNTKKSKKDLLEDAQNLSLENPKSFLEEAEVANENKTASSATKIVIGKPVVEKEKTDSSKGNEKKIPSLKKSVFTIVDERGSTAKEEVSKTQKTKLTVSKDSESGNELNLTMTINKNVEQNILSSNNQTAGATGSNFQAMLSEQIQQNAPEFVKAGNIVLQDSKNGTINMVLKPESLGNVKISLQLSDKVITGQITVQSQEAYDAFKQNLETLKQAFQQSGFETPTFNLSFSNNGGGSQNFSQGQQQMANSWFGNQTYGDFASGSEAVTQSDLVPSKKDSSYAIDFVA